MSTPTTSRKRTRRPEDRRQDLLDAAVHVFRARGVHEATVAEIAEKAGVAKGTFYIYFESREHLLASLREQMVEQTLERAMHYYHRLGQDDLWSLVDGMIEAMVGLLYEQREMILAVTSGALSPETAEVFAECDRRLNELVADGIRKGIAAGQFDVVNPGATAALVNNAIEGAVIEALIYESGLTEAEIIESSKELVHKTLAR